MISTSDKEYEATKRIKQGAAKLTAPFDELARWISSTWQATVLNVIYDSRNPLHAPRLQVILEHDSEKKGFQCGINFDQEKQSAIRDKFVALIGAEARRKYDVDGLFVVFSAFAPLALEEADSRITEEDRKSLQRRIGDPDLWEVSRCFASVTFFFHTDAQVKRSGADGRQAAYSKMYFDLLKPHDEFGYLDEKTFTVAFDSKQNLDDNYNGNWYQYYR